MSHVTHETRHAAVFPLLNSSMNTEQLSRTAAHATSMWSTHSPRAAPSTYTGSQPARSSTLRSCALCSLRVVARGLLEGSPTPSVPRPCCKQVSPRRDREPSRRCGHGCGEESADEAEDSLPTTQRSSDPRMRLGTWGEVGEARALRTLPSRKPSADGDADSRWDSYSRDAIGDARGRVDAHHQTSSLRSASALARASSMA